MNLLKDNKNKNLIVELRKTNEEKDEKIKQMEIELNN